MEKGRLQTRTVKQILDVLAGYKRGRQAEFGPLASYRNAVGETSNRFNVSYQTIGDACVRRLGLEKVDEFLKYLSKWWYEGDTEGLIILITKFVSSADRDRVKIFFSGEVDDVNIIEIEEEILDGTISLHFDKDTVKRLRTLSGGEGISVNAWLRKEIIGITDKKILAWMREQLEKLPPDERNTLLRSIR